VSSSSSAPPPAAPEPWSTLDKARWFAEEVRPHEAAVRGYLRNRFPSLDTDDVVQESYLKLLKLHAAQKVASAKAYFYAIARNTALTIFRRSRIYSDIPLSELPDSLCLDEDFDAAESTDTRERLEMVVAAIDSLPARCREVTQLSVLEGLPSAQIAVRLGIAESTVRVQIVRGVQRCAEFLRERT
jgi:RNA polymerase sigma factor (sigma-70 family)